MSISSAIAELAARLGTVASVRIGRAALETTSAQLPVITLWSTRDQMAADLVYDWPNHTRTLVVEYKGDGAAADYHEGLDSALASMRALLVPDADGEWLGGAALSVRRQGATFFHPGNGSEVAAVQLTIEIDY